MSAPADNVDFSFVVEGDLTDEAISALASFLLDMVNGEAAGMTTSQSAADPRDVVIDSQPKGKAS